MRDQRIGGEQATDAAADDHDPVATLHRAHGELRARIRKLLRRLRCVQAILLQREATSAASRNWATQKCGSGRRFAMRGAAQICHRCRSQLAACRRCCWPALAHASQPRHRPMISEPLGENHRAVSGRRHRRCGAAARRRLAVAQMGPAGGDREPHRRRRKYRRRTGLSRGARRLHAALGAAAAARHQPESLSEPGLRSDEVRADHRDGAGAERAHRQSEQDQGDERAGIHRVPESQSRQGHLAPRRATARPRI